MRAVVFWFSLFLAGCFDVPSDRLRVKTQIFEINKKYKSMQGPEQKLKVRWSRESKVFMTRLAVSFSDPQRDKALGSEFLCHSHLTVLPEDLSRRDQYKLMTLSQGQVELEFPKGFGLAVTPSDDIFLEARILNLNREGSFQVQQTFEMEWTRKDLKPLATRTLVFYHPTTVQHQGSERSCIPTQEHLAAGSVVTVDGQKMTSHWMVMPGHYESTHNVTRQLNLKQPIRVHAGIVHLHPFAQSFSLRNADSNKELIRFDVKNEQDRVGIAAIQPFQSEKGVLLQPKTSYELVVVYHNTTSQPIDAMAGMYLFTAPGD